MTAKPFKDLYPAAKSKIFAADKEVDEKERNKQFFEMSQSLKKNMKALKQAEDWSKFGVIQKILIAETINNPVSFLVFTPSDEHCKNLEKYTAEINKSWVVLSFERAEELKKAASISQQNYLDRHRFIERAIRLILNLLDDKNQWKHEGTPQTGDTAYKFIAECYLLRSRLILPKGSATPERKIEALNNALGWAKMLSKKDDLLNAEIILEKVRWDKNFTEVKAYSFFDTLFKKNKVSIGSNITYWEINDVYQTLNLKFNKSRTKKLEKYDKKVLKEKNRKFSSSLYKARAAIRVGEENIGGYLDQAVSRLQRNERPIPLVSPLWDDTVETVGRAAGNPDRKGQWENSAIRAWEICMKAEDKLKQSFHVRWYWARQKDLYNLAFQAALNKAETESEFYVKAAEIADSQKSRPTMKLLDIEQSLKDGKEKENFQKLIDADFKDFLDTFITGIDEPDINKKSEETKLQDNRRMITHVPEGWAAVHFYVIDKYNAHAVILKKDFKIAVSLEINMLWQVFSKWENARRGFEIGEDVEPYLKDLLKETEKTLQPILEQTKDKNLLLIPHGFLHLVPFHAAILQKQSETIKNTVENTGFFSRISNIFKDKKNNFSKLISCMYLPSWSLAPEKGTNILSTGNCLFHSNLNDIDDYQELIEPENNNSFWSNKILEHVKPEEAITELKESSSNIQLYALFCHARGHMNNPYNGRFLLNKENLTFGQIRSKPLEFKGSRVILTACETDLVISNIGLTDEHLSLASAFLEKEAVEVIGTLFKCNPTMAKEFLKNTLNILKTKPDTPLCQILADWQLELFKDNNSLHKIIPFRAIGFPVWDEVKK